MPGDRANRLTLAQKMEIHSRYMSENTTMEKLGAEYGVTAQAVWNIVTRINSGKNINDIRKTKADKGAKK